MLRPGQGSGQVQGGTGKRYREGPCSGLPSGRSGNAGFQIIPGVENSISGYLIEDSLERFILHGSDGQGLRGKVPSGGSVNHSGKKSP